MWTEILGQIKVWIKHKDINLLNKKYENLFQWNTWNIHSYLFKCKTKIKASAPKLVDDRDKFVGKSGRMKYIINTVFSDCHHKWLIFRWAWVYRVPFQCHFWKIRNSFIQDKNSTCTRQPQITRPFTQAFSLSEMLQVFEKI